MKTLDGFFIQDTGNQFYIGVDKKIKDVLERVLN
jgi:hypothetical protein